MIEYLSSALFPLAMHHCLTLPPLTFSLSEPHGVELKGVGSGLLGVSERNPGEGHVGQLPRPRAFSQSAVHSLERSEKGNTQALAELSQVRPCYIMFSPQPLYSNDKQRFLSLVCQF